MNLNIRLLNTACLVLKLICAPCRLAETFTGKLGPVDIRWSAIVGVSHIISYQLAAQALMLKNYASWLAIRDDAFTSLSNLIGATTY